MRKSLNIGLFNVGSIFETQVEILVEDNPLPVTNVQVKLTVPPGVSLADSHLPVGSYNPALEVWSLGTLPPNTHIEGSFTWQVDDINQAPYVFDFHMSATGCVKCFSDSHFQIYAFGFTCQDIQPCFVGGGGGGITLADVDDWLGDIGSIADPNTGAQNVMVRNFANPAEKTVLSYDQIFTASPTFSLRLAGATPVLSFGVGTGRSSIIPVLPTYPDFLAVDADAQLPDFSLFRIQGDATVYQKLPGTTAMPHADIPSIGDIDDVDLSGALLSDMVLAYDSTTKTWKPKINPGAITPISVNVANLGTDTITFEITGGPAQGPGIIPAFQVYLNDGTDYTVNGAGLQIGTGSTANTVAAQLATALENDINNNVFGTQATVNVNGPLVTLSIPGKLITTLSLPTGAVPGTGLGGGGTQIKSISDVPDVDVTGPVNGELLVWDAPLGAWVNKDVNKPPVATGLSYSITGTGTDTLTVTILGNAATDSGVFPALVLTDGTNTINVPEVPFATGTSFAKLRDDIKAAIDAVSAGWIGGVTATGRDVVIQSTGSLFTTPDQAVTTIMPPPILTLASLSDIGDVDTTGVSDTNIIQYDAATQTWVVRDIKGASQGTGITTTVSGTGTDTLQIAVTGGPATNPGQIGPFTITDGTNTLQIPEVYFTTGEDAQTIEARLAITIDNIADPAWIQSVNDTATGIVIRTTGSTFTTSTLPNGEITSSTIPIINVLGDIGNVDTSGAAQHTVLAWEATSQTWVPKDAATIVEKKSGLNVAVSGIGSTVLTVTVTGGIAQLDGSIDPFIISDGTNVLNVPEVPFLTGQRDDQVAVAIAAAIPSAAWIASVNTAANVITITSNGTNFTDTTIPVGDIDFPDVPVINKLSDIPDVDTSGIMTGDILVWNEIQDEWVAVRPKGRESNVALEIDTSLPTQVKLTFILPGLTVATAGVIPAFILRIGTSIVTIPPVPYNAGDSIQQIITALDTVVKPLLPSGTTTQIIGRSYIIANTAVNVFLESGLKEGNIPGNGIYSPISIDLRDLMDVSGVPSTDDILVYDGSQWVPKTLIRKPTGIVITKSEGAATTLTTSGTATANGQIDEFVIRFTDQAPNPPTEVTITDTPFTAGETGDVIISRIAQKIRTATGALTVIQNPGSDTISINYTGPGTLTGDIEIGVVNNSQPGTSPPPVLALEDLTDVDTVFAKADDFLQFDGNNWIGATLNVSPQTTGITFNALKSPGDESMFFNVLNGPAQADGEIPAFVVTVTDGTTMTTSTIGPVPFSAGDSVGTILNSLAAALDSSAIGQLPGMQTQVSATNVGWTDASSPRKLLFTSNAPVGGSIVTNPPAPFTTTLRDLLDTDLTTIPATHGKALVYSANTQKWVPGEVFTNIDLTTPAEDKQVLYYDAPSANWKPINVLTDRTEVNTGIEVEVNSLGFNGIVILFSGGPALADGEVPSFEINAVKTAQTTTQTITATPFSKGDTVDQIAAAVYAKLQNGPIDNDPGIDITNNANSIFFAHGPDVTVLTDLPAGILFALNPNAVTGLLDLGLDNLKDVVAFAPFARQVIAYDNVLKEWTTNSIFGDHISTGLEIEGTYSLSNFWIRVKGSTATHAGVIPAFEITRYDISKSLGSEVGTESFGPYTVNTGDSVQDVIDMIFPDIQGSALFATGLTVRKLTDSIVISAGGTNPDYAARYTTTFESGEISGGTTDGLYSRLLSLQEDVNMAHLTGSSEQFLHYDPTSQMWVPDELFGTLPVSSGISTSHAAIVSDTHTIVVSGGPATGDAMIPRFRVVSTAGNTYEAGPVDILTGESAADVATKIEAAINAANPTDFTISRVGDTITLVDSTGTGQSNTIQNVEYYTDYEKGVVDDSLYDYLNYKLFVFESAPPPTQTGYYVDRGLYGITIRDDRDPSKRALSIFRNSLHFGGDAGDLSSIFVRGVPMVRFNDDYWHFDNLRTRFDPLIDPATTNGFNNEIVFNATGIHRWNGSQWQNVAWGGGAGASTLSGLTDVTLTTPAADDVLYYDGSDWVNQNTFAGLEDTGFEIINFQTLLGNGLLIVDGPTATADGVFPGFVYKRREKDTGILRTLVVDPVPFSAGDARDDIFDAIETAITTATASWTFPFQVSNPSSTAQVGQFGFSPQDGTAYDGYAYLSLTPTTQNPLTIQHPGDGLIRSIDDIADVDTSADLHAGDILAYDGVVWRPKIPISVVEDLHNVEVDNLQTGDLLMFGSVGGTANTGWTNTRLTLEDVAGVTPEDNQVLVYSDVYGGYVSKNIYGRNPQPGSATYLDVVVTPDGGGEGFVIEISESANHPNPGNGAEADAIFPAFTIDTGSNTYQVPAVNVLAGESPEQVIDKIRTAIVNAGYTGTDANEQIDPAAGATNVIKVLYQTGFAGTDLPEDVVLGGTPGIIKSIDDIPDVNAPTPNDGDVLSYNAATDEWLSIAPATGAGPLVDLTDVDAQNPEDKQVLYWNAANSDWEPSLITDGYIGDTGLTLDVDTGVRSSADAIRVQVTGGTAQSDGVIPAFHYCIDYPMKHEFICIHVPDIDIAVGDTEDAVESKITQAMEDAFNNHPNLPTGIAAIAPTSTDLTAAQGYAGWKAFMVQGSNPYDFSINIAKGPIPTTRQPGLIGSVREIADVNVQDSDPKETIMWDPSSKEFVGGPLKLLNEVAYTGTGNPPKVWRLDMVGMGSSAKTQIYNPNGSGILTIVANNSTNAGGPSLQLKDTAFPDEDYARDYITPKNSRSIQTYGGLKFAGPRFVRQYSSEAPMVKIHTGGVNVTIAKHQVIHTESKMLFITQGDAPSASNDISNIPNFNGLTAEFNKQVGTRRSGIASIHYNPASMNFCGIMTDGDFLYVLGANNQWKRVALQTF